MSGARRGPNQGIDIYYSDVVTVGTTITLDGISPVKPHCFLGLQFFDDAAGATPGTATAGTADVEVRTVNNEPNYEPTPVATIDATAPDTVSWAGNTTGVRVTPSSITGAAYYRAVVTTNET